MTILKRAPMSNRAVLDWLGGLGWQVAHGPDIAPDTPSAERDDNPYWESSGSMGSPSEMVASS